MMTMCPRCFELYSEIDYILSLEELREEIGYGYVQVP